MYIWNLHTLYTFFESKRETLASSTAESTFTWFSSENQYFEPRLLQILALILHKAVL